MAGRFPSNFDGHGPLPPGIGLGIGWSGRQLTWPGNRLGNGLFKNWIGQVQKNRKTQKPCGEKMNGAKRIRTADPLHAMQVLYQLSYGPIGALGVPNPGDSVGLEGPDSALVELTPQRVQALRAGARRPQACPGR